MRFLRKLCLLVAGLMAAHLVAPVLPAGAESYDNISGEGSSWSGNFISYVLVQVRQFGLKVNYAATSSGQGRTSYDNGTVDFAGSDIPFQFQPEDGSEPDKPPGGRGGGAYAYIPITAGGTSLMYNLKIGGKRVADLRLSGENVAKIFTGVITRWNDPKLLADNPGLALPDRQIVPVIRSDPSGSTAQFTMWLIHNYPAIWNDYCKRSGRAPACGFTSIYPFVKGMIKATGDQGVAGYLINSYAEGAIGYTNYSYALNSQFPVVKMLNAAGYYTEPTPENVAVSLLKAQINNDPKSDDYLTQKLDNVYTDTDKRNYQLSSYSYLIVPTKLLPPPSKFTTGKGRSLGVFTYYTMCQAQEASASLGYSPMPINLVQAAFDQIKRIPGVVVQDIDIRACKNPTFSTDGSNTLAKNAPQPADCDKQGPAQCTGGTGGLREAVAQGVGQGGGTQGGGGKGGGTQGGGGQGAANPTTDQGAGAGGTVGGTGDGTAAGADSDAPGGDAGAGTSQVCDPETGACQPASTGSGTSGARTSQQSASSRGNGEATASPAVLAGAVGWSASKALVAFVLLLTLALVLVPAAVWGYVSRRDGP